MASLMPHGKQQYFDSNGNPLAGGRVYTFEAGTSTPLASYSDAAGAVPNTNPVLLNARGEASIFWGDAPYKVVVKDASDVEIYTQDNLQPFVPRDTFDASISALYAMVESVTVGNKIINPSFAINQRGYVSGTATTTANQYTLDRWRVVASGQSVTLATSGNGNQVTAPAGGYEQVIEGASVEGGVYTLSWTGTATATVNGTAITNGGQTAALTAGADVTVRFSGGTVADVMFKRGSVVKPFESRPIGLELALCQRYYEVSYASARLAVSSGTPTLETPVKWAVTKRTAPTVTAGTPYMSFALASGPVFASIDSAGCSMRITGSAADFGWAGPVIANAEI